MSAIAEFTKLPLEALPGLTADYHGTLLKWGESVADYNWSGWVFNPLLVLLDESGILIGESAYSYISDEFSQKMGTTVIFLTADHKKFLPRLSDDSFSLGELRDFYNEFNEASEAGVGIAMLDGIRCIRKSLEAVDDKSVVLLSIG